jgi:hypothetical protein
MEVYTLDELLRRTEVIDSFESCIWTERWAGWGDFEISIESNFRSRSLLQNGVQLAHSESNRVMTVETVEDGVTSEGVHILKVKGRSIESIFEDRVAKPSLDDLTTEPTWDLTGTPGAIMRQIVHDICYTGVLSEWDKIPYLVEARHPDIPADTIVEPVDPIILSIEPRDVYSVLTDVGNTWTLGFRLLRAGDMPQLYFDVYAGIDRTTHQTTYRPVIFAPELDNLENTKFLSTIEGAKNVAYVFSPVGFKEVIPSGVDEEIEGFERRVLMVKADDITSGTPAEIDSALIQRGKEALAEHRAFQAFDGEIRQQNQYTYGVDYLLGDLVEMRNVDGVTNQMRVVEQIFVSDKEGERAYPTLELNTFINTGSWLSWESNKKWIDYDADTDTVWAVLP